MRSSVRPICFCPTPCINPHTYSGCLSPRRMLCCNLESQHQSIDLRITAIAHTVRPFERVVLSVFTPLLVVTGVAKPLFNGVALKAARLRRPCARLRANRRDAMAVMLDVVTINWGEQDIRSKSEVRISSESLNQSKAAKSLTVSGAHNVTTLGYCLTIPKFNFQPSISIQSSSWSIIITGQHGINCTANTNSTDVSGRCIKKGLFD